MAAKSPAATPSILLFAEYSETGGTRTYLKQLLALYAEKRARVTMVRTHEHKGDEIASLCRQYGFDCIDLRSIVGARNILGRRPLVRFFLERRLIGRYLRQSAPDIVVASVGTPGLFLGALSCASKPLYILHTYPHDAAKGRIKSLLRCRLYSTLISSATQILTVSHYSRNRILGQWGLQRRADMVKVVYSTAGDSLGSGKLHEGSKINLLTVGHVETYKNPETWIKVALLLRKRSPDLNIRLNWVGDGSRLDELRTRVAALGAESYIRFIGRDNSVGKYYELCDVYLQPSLVESLGLSVLDAMRHGKPCVVANTGGMPEIISDGESGWVVEADDAESMAMKIELLARDKQLRASMGRHAREIYKSRFSKSRWANEIWSVHEQLLHADQVRNGGDGGAYQDAKII